MKTACLSRGIGDKIQNFIKKREKKIHTNSKINENFFIIFNLLKRSGKYFEISHILKTH